MASQIEEMVRLFNTRNCIILGASHIMCSKCSCWLTPPIFLIEDGTHICEACLTRIDRKSLRDPNLEKLLVFSKYPCKYAASGCDVVLTFDKLHGHERDCNYNISCTCQQTLDSKDALIQHLKEQHTMMTIVLRKPVALIQLSDMNIDFTAYHLESEGGATSLIMLLFPNVIGNTIDVAINNISDIRRHLKFMIIFKHYNISDGGFHEYRACGIVSNSSRLLEGRTPRTKLSIPGLKMHALPLLFHIYFDNYENYEKLEDHFGKMRKEYKCPVCSNIINDTYNQCSKGHLICSTCLAKRTFKTCPSCQMKVNCNLTTKNKVANLYRPCKNVRNGCFKYLLDKEMGSHECFCEMRKISCNSCGGTRFDHVSYIHHMTVIHDMQMMNASPAIVHPGYMFYRGKIFHLDFNSELQPLATMKCTWLFRHLYTSTMESIQCEYKLVIAIADEIVSIKSRTRRCEAKHEYNFYGISIKDPFILTLTL